MPPDRADTPEPQGSRISDPDRRRLAEMVTALGEAVTSAGNQPLWLDDPGSLWLVERGALDVHLVSVRDGAAEAPFRHILRLDAGHFAFGARGATELRLLARGVRGTVVRRVRAAELVAAFAEHADALDRSLANDADHWIAGILSMIAAEIEVRPRPDAALVEGAATAPAGVLTSAEGVVWIDGAAAHLFGTEEPEPGEIVPLTPESWAVTHDGTARSVLRSRTLGAETLLTRALPGFHRLAFEAESFNRRLLLADQANLQMARSVWRRRDEDEARAQLFTLLDPSPPAVAGDDALLAALHAVGRHERIAIRAPDVRNGETRRLADVLHASGVRARTVRLSPQERWWRGDSGAMLGFRRADGSPVALLPGTAGRYRLYDPQTATSSPVRHADAEELAPEACVIYPPLPDDGPVSMRTLLASAASGASADIVRAVCTQVAATLLALAPAAGIGVLASSVIPSGDGGLLLQLALLLVLLAVSAALFHVLRGAALARIEARFAARATAALWDRLLRLPTRFHRRYSSGEITMMAMAFQAVRDRVSGATGTALLSALFMVPSLSLVFLYDATLGLLTLGIGLAALAVTVAFGFAQTHPQRRRSREERRLAGYLLQIIGCVRKLQASGAEGSARASWARRYRAQKLADMRIGILNEHMQAFGASVPLLAAAALFAAAHVRGDTLEVGEFLVAYVASMIFYGSVVALGAAVESIASVVPVAEQALPILAATPDTARRRGPSVVLAGGLRFESVSFRYHAAGPLVLDRVSLHAMPGEFIAIVGESGSGKSTLVRLALGMDVPARGAVYYDNRDLAHLDPVSVRRQVGTVLQDGEVRIGTVLDNIIGMDQALTIDDAWRAARAAVVDREIAGMPMQMHTGIGERAAMVSGGQSQRIRIAQALVRNPPILLLDEATNWLDRRNQAALMEGIRNSTATRIVIAHRISTIRDAHRIYVLKAGKVVQVGRFEDLLDTDGPFRDLVRRQMS